MSSSSSTSRKLRRRHDLRESSNQYFQQSKVQQDEYDYNHRHGHGHPMKKPQKQHGISQTQYYGLLKFIIGSLFGLAYFIYVSNLFEAVTKFTHLSEMERELSLPPDVAFRYSYFKHLSESETFFHGFISSLKNGESDKSDDDDSQQGSNSNSSSKGSHFSRNICTATKMMNPFRKHLLTAEVLQGGVFHLLKRFKERQRWRTWTATSKFSPTCHYPDKDTNTNMDTLHNDVNEEDDGDVVRRSSSARSSVSTKQSNRRSNSMNSQSKTKDVEVEEEEDEQVQIGKVDGEDGGNGDLKKCFHSSFNFGLGSLFYFYINSIWIIEAIALILLYYFGCKLSKSIFGGGVSVVIFLVIHPQRTNSDWIFSFDNKIEWIIFLIQMWTVSQSVLKTSTYPSWTSTVKVALSTAAVFLFCSSTRSQCVLISQLVIITFMEIFGIINPYIASLVLFGQLTGWQYATMVLLDTSFGNYSPFLCILATCICTVYIAQPLLQHGFGFGTSASRNSNILLRVPCLLVASQVILYTIVTITTISTTTTTTAAGNSRYSWSFFLPPSSSSSSSSSSVIYNSVNVNCEEVLEGQMKFSSTPAQRDHSSIDNNNNNNIIKIPNHHHHNHDDNDAAAVLDFHSSRENSHTTSHSFLSSLLCSSSSSSSLCNYPVLSYTWGTFLSKYVLQLLTSIYVIAIGLVLPIVYYYYYVKSSGSSAGAAASSEAGAGTRTTKIGPFAHNLDPILPPPATATAAPVPANRSSHPDTNLLSSTTKLVSLSQVESFFINESTPLITFNILQLLCFIYFCIHLGSSWELVFVSQLALLCSLLCDQERITFVFGSFNSRKPLFSNKVALHWCIVLGIFLSLLTTTKHGSNQMLQNSRAKYEIGNKKIQDLTEAMKWIQANVPESEPSNSCFVGLEIPLLYLHLTTRKNYIFHNYYYNELLYDLHGLQQQNNNMANISTRTHNEESLVSLPQAFEDVYRIFNRRTSILEYYNKLKVFNATHLFLSRESCTFKSPRATTQHQQQQQKHSSPFSGDDSLKEEDAAAAVAAGATPTFSFVWSTASKKATQGNELGIHFRRSCDLSRVWDAVMTVTAVQGQDSHPGPATATSTTAKTGKRKEKSGSKKDVQMDVSASTSTSSNYDVDFDDDILCLHLLNDPDIRPFKKVFENSEYAILSFPVDHRKKDTTNVKKRSRSKNLKNKNET